MKILVAGGDERQKYMYEILKEKGVWCDYISSNSNKGLMNNISSYSVIILPVPLSRDNKKIYSSDRKLDIYVDELFGIVNANQFIIGGNIPEQYVSSTHKCIDLLKQEEFVLFNAFLTAQGALALLLENTQDYLQNKKVLVTGFGKVGKAVCRIMKLNGLDVSVSVRKEKDFLDADQLGYNAVCYNEFNEIISDFDYIFSTVPARIFEEHHIRDMKKSVVYFELASAPYGCDKSLFEKCDKKYIMGNVLPGRYCAKSWAEEAVRYCFDNLKGDNI